MRLVRGKLFKPSSNFHIDCFRAIFLSLTIFVICINLCHAAISVTCSFEVTYWERSDLLALLYVMFSCVLSLTHMGQVCYLIVSISDLCILSYFGFDVS